MADVLRDFWALFAGAVGVIVWLMRLESRSISNEREIKRLWHQRTEDMQAAQKQSDSMNALLAEMRADIKTLLGRRD